MFQLRALNRDLIPELLAQVRASDDALESRADRLVARLREAQRQAAPRYGLATRLAVRLDRALRSDAPEYLDREDCPDADKVAIVAGLDRLNRRLHAYDRFLAILKPVIDRIHARERRPVRVLELASGAGDFTLELARKARAARLPVTVQGSDYLDAHVAEGNRKAAAAGLEVGFRNINAFAMDNVADGEFDLIFLTQTLHHFSPGQLARVVEQAGHKARHAFVGIDVMRSPHVWGIVPVMALLNPHRGFLHDGILSIRKMYSGPELELIAMLAAPQAQVRTWNTFPGYSVLEVTSRRG